jgi:hypothetical protein
VVRAGYLDRRSAGTLAGRAFGPLGLAAQRILEEPSTGAVAFFFVLSGFLPAQPAARPSFFYLYILFHTLTLA